MIMIYYADDVSQMYQAPEIPDANSNSSKLKQKNINAYDRLRPKHLDFFYGRWFNLENPDSDF